MRCLPILLTRVHGGSIHTVLTDEFIGCTGGELLRTFSSPLGSPHCSRARLGLVRLAVVQEPPDVLHGARALEEVYGDRVILRALVEAAGRQARHVARAVVDAHVRHVRRRAGRRAQHRRAQPEAKRDVLPLAAVGEADGAGGPCARATERAARVGARCRAPRGAATAGRRVERHAGAADEVGDGVRGGDVTDEVLGKDLEDTVGVPGACARTSVGGRWHSAACDGLRQGLAGRGAYGKMGWAPRLAQPCRT